MVQSDATETEIVPQIKTTDVVPRDELEKTGETEHGPVYECPRCGYSSVSEYCDCPKCHWAGMCQEEFDD